MQGRKRGGTRGVAEMRRVRCDGNYTVSNVKVNSDVIIPMAPLSSSHGAISRICLQYLHSTCFSCTHENLHHQNGGKGDDMQMGIRCCNWRLCSVRYTQVSNDSTGRELPDGTREYPQGGSTLLASCIWITTIMGKFFTLAHERHGDPCLYPRSPSPHQYDLP